MTEQEQDQETERERYRLTDEYDRYTAAGLHIESGKAVELHPDRAEPLVERGVLERAGGPETNDDDESDSEGSE